MSTNAHDAASGQGVFVIGCPRSGTYLLSSMLTARFGVAIPLETHFIPLFSRFLPLWGDQSRARNRRALMRDVLDFLTVWGWASRELDCREDEAATLLGVRDQADEVADRADSFGAMIEGLFSRFAAARGMTRWGDKSAFYRPQPLDLFQKAVPGLKVVHCVRDPRDVVMSWRKIWCGPKTVTEAALAWRGHVRAYREWGERNPERYFEFRYEDLLDGPEDLLARLAGFLGLPLLSEDEAMTDEAMTRTLSRLKTHRLIGGGIRPENKEKWRKAMPAGDIAHVEWLAHDAIRAFGYPLSGDGAKPSGGLRRRIAESARELFSTRRVQLLAKDVLPLCLRVKSWLGLPLPSFFSRLEGRADKG